MNFLSSFGIVGAVIAVFVFLSVIKFIIKKNIQMAITLIVIFGIIMALVYFGIISVMQM